MFIYIIYPPPLPPGNHKMVTTSVIPFLVFRLVHLYPFLDSAKKVISHDIGLTDFTLNDSLV